MATGTGHRAPLIGSLLLGVHAPAGLQYCGQAGTGFTDAALHDLARRLAAIERPGSPFATAVPAAQARHAHWVRPVLAAEMTFAEWTPGGRDQGGEPAVLASSVHLCNSSGTEHWSC